MNFPGTIRHPSVCLPVFDRQHKLFGLFYFQLKQSKIIFYNTVARNIRLCSHLMPEHQCLGTGTKWCCVQTLGTRYVGMFRFNKPSTCPLHLKCANRIIHAFRVQYICLIIAFYGFFTFFMLCFYMKHLRDQMDYDDRRRLARIVTETCAAISRRLNVLLCFVQGVS